MTRKRLGRFARASILLCSGVFLALPVVGASAEGVRDDGEARVRREVFLMGTRASLVVATEDRLQLAETGTVPVGTFEQGTQGALRFEVLGIVNGKPGIVVEHVTRIHDDAAPDWPRSPDGHGAHGVRITGKPCIDLSIESDYPGGDRVAGGNATAAAHVVNAIPAVCRAEPGLLDILDLPLVIGKGLLRPA